MPTPWTYDPKSRRYRAPNGQFIGQKKMLALRDEFSKAVRAEAVRLTAQAPAGRIGMAQWQADMRQLIKQAYIDEYALARGGRGRMTAADWGKIGAMLKIQYTFLERMAADMGGSAISPAQMIARAQMYVSSATQAFEQGKSAAMGMPDLPAYPGDGSTQCLSNCKCSWHIVDGGDHGEATWTLGAAEHCPDCSDRAASWAPLVLPYA